MTTQTKWNFFETSVVAKNFPTPYAPIIYNVHQTDKVTGYAIPTDVPQAVTGLQINPDTPVLRVAKADGTFFITSDHNSSQYYIFVYWDQNPQKDVPALWQGTTSTQNFALTLDMSKSGLHAFSLTPA